MFINDPKNILRLADSEDGLTDDGTHYLFRMHRDVAKTYWESIDLEPSDEAYAEASNFIAEITELDFSVEATKKLLALYPQTRIKLADSNGTSPTHVRDDLTFAVANFFLGSRWPTFGDNIDVDRFVEILQQEAKALGFKKSN